MDKKSNLYAMDFIDGDHLEVMQLERMKKIIRHAFNNVEFYRNRMRKYNLTPDSIKTLEDTKIDLYSSFELILTNLSFYYHFKY